MDFVLAAERLFLSDDCVLQTVPKKTTKSPTRRIYKLSQKQIPAACENGSVAKGEGNISTRSRTKRFRSSRKNDLDLRRSTIDTVGYDPYERYLDLTSQHRDRFMRIMENMREKTSYQYQRAAEKTRHYEEKDQKLHDFIPKPGLTHFTQMSPTVRAYIQKVRKLTRVQKCQIVSVI